MAKQKNWSTAQTNVVVKQFNLFRTSGGKKGWDPRRSSDKTYVARKLSEDPITRAYLKKAAGGHSSNKDNAKAYRGYQQVSCEYWVLLGIKGIQKCKRILSMSR